MATQQAGLCLSCGAPFCPKPTDEINYDSLGNMSLAYINRQVRINKDAMTKIEHPAFYGVQESSHIIHKSHHRGAVKIMANERADTDITDNQIDQKNGLFPFILAPESKKNSRPMVAEWNVPDSENRINLTSLSTLCAEIEKGSKDGDDMNKDYTLMAGCCKSCNSTMTMEYWFRYHLYADEEGEERNRHRIIQDSPITLYNVKIDGGIKNIEKYDKWRKKERVGDFPDHDTPRNKEYMAPAVAYYLHLCLPFEDHHLLHDDEKERNKSLYVELCWVVLEIACLMCEYWRGSGDKENKQGSSKKRNQSHKSPLGAIELYFGYFCW